MATQVQSAPVEASQAGAVQAVQVKTASTVAQDQDKVGAVSPVKEAVAVEESAKAESQIEVPPAPAAASKSDSAAAAAAAPSDPKDLKSKPMLTQQSPQMVVL